MKNFQDTSWWLPSILAQSPDKPFPRGDHQENLFALVLLLQAPIQGWACFSSLMGDAAPRGAVEVRKSLWVMRSEASGPRGAGERLLATVMISVQGRGCRGQA